MASSTFWETNLGRSIRWLVYVPIGIALLVLVQSLASMFFSWLFHDGRDFFIIGILLGGVTVLPALGMIYYLAFFLIAEICPSPKPGMIVFGTIFYLFAAANMLYIFSPSQEFQLSAKHFVTWVIACVIAAFALRAIWVRHGKE